MRAFHERIEWVRKALGRDGKKLSVRQLAIRADMVPQTLQQWVKRSKETGGKTPGTSALLSRCAKAWQVDLAWLSDGEGVPRPDALDALETVLSEEDWGDEARAAAEAARKRGARKSRAAWRLFLSQIRRISETPDDRPAEVIDLKGGGS